MNDRDNFFQLKEGDIIQEGDECLCDEEWEPAKHEIGTPTPDPLKIAHRIYRRRKPEKTNYAVCQSCGSEIAYDSLNGFWKHTKTNPRHPAKPKQLSF